MKTARSAVALLLEASPRSAKKAVRALTPERALRWLRRRNTIPYLEAAQVEHRLWRGFANRAVGDLERIRNNPRSASSEAVLAARALARFHAVNEKFKKALDYLAFIQRKDPEYKRNNRILEIHCLMQLNRIAEARKLVEDALARGISHDGCMNAAMASSWIHEAKQKVVSADEAAAAYLEHMSRPLRAGGHVGVTRRDPSRPLSLDNLAPESPPPTPDSMPAKVSVLMAVHNSAAHVETAIRSILEQSWRNLELVVVDDASTDDSWSIIQRLAREDDRILPIRHSDNGGAYVARNTALAHASGDYIVVNDADDWAHPQKIEAQVSHLLRYPNVTGNMTFRVRIAQDMTAVPRLDSAHVPILHNDYSALMLSRERALEMGGWDTVRFSADAEFVERLAAIDGPKAMQRIRGGMPMSFSLWSPNSLTMSSATNIMTNRFGSRHEYVRHFREWHQSGNDLTSRRTSPLLPFPVPGICHLESGRIQEFDVILVSDLASDHDLVRRNLEFLKEAKNQKLRTAILHWPRYEAETTLEMDRATTATLRKLGIIPLVHGEQASCRMLVVHEPSRLSTPMDQVPQINAARIVLASEAGNCPTRKSLKLIARTFGRKGEWSSSTRLGDLLSQTSLVD